MADYWESLDTFRDFERALQFLDDEEKKRLESYQGTVMQRKAKAEQRETYKKAMQIASRGKDFRDYDTIIEMFQSISGYQDADRQVERFKNEKEEYCEEIYQSGVREKEKGTVFSFRNASHIFKRIEGYKDAGDQIRICKEQAERTGPSSGFMQYMTIRPPASISRNTP